jgi:hypothetical protein
MRKRNRRGEQEQNRRVMEVVCKSLGAKLIRCNMYKCGLKVDRLALDLYNMVGYAKNQGMKIGVVLCPGCGEVVLEFEIVD